MKTIFLFIIIGLIIFGFIVKREKEKSYKRGYKDAVRIYKSTGVIPEYIDPDYYVGDKVLYIIGFYDAIIEMRRE